MIRVLIERLRQGHRTRPFPPPESALPERYLGRPEIRAGLCAADCRACLAACPTGALERADGGLRLDLGRCLFCGACARACPAQAVRFTRDYRLAARRREELWVSAAGRKRARNLYDAAHRMLGRSLKLRQVSAGGCNACEADTNVLQTLVYDLGRFGIQFVASPRHADGLLITGPLTENMRLALRKTWEAVPAPRLVVAVGACAISGGPFAGHPETHDGVTGEVPVDLYVPGCPPHPYTILDGLVGLLRRRRE